MPQCKDDAIAAIFRKSLQFLRGRDYDITDELNEMIDRKQKKQSLMTSSSGSWTSTTTPSSAIASSGRSTTGSSALTSYMKR